MTDFKSYLLEKGSKLMGQGSQGDKVENNGLSQSEIEWAIEKNVDCEIDFSESFTKDFAVGYESLQRLTELSVYREKRNDIRIINFLNFNKDYFNVRVRIKNKDELEVTLEELYYTGEEINNEHIGRFVDRFSHNGPNVRFDIETEPPTLSVYSR